MITGVVPSGVTYPSGTPVQGTDYNAAYALLLRWWGLLDAPAHVDTTPFWQDLADDEFSVDLHGIRSRGRSALVGMIADLRARGDLSHQIGFDDMSLEWIDTDKFSLVAEAVEQATTPTGGFESRRCRYTAELIKQASGRLLLHSITAAILDEAPATEFNHSYVVNRAKATMIQFQTHTDLLTGDAGPMRELLMPELELNGLVNSKADQTQPGTEAFTDVRALRETISTSERKQDNVIRTFEEFSDWFASCTALFRKNGFHKLERFEVTEMPERRYQVVAQFHWRAETINGAAISLHTPLTWILVDTGEKYMRIEKLLPFG